MPNTSQTAADWPNEACIEHTNGMKLCFAAYPENVSYARVIGPDGVQIAYWTVDEVAEDPADVLGAIFGAVLGSPLDQSDQATSA